MPARAALLFDRLTSETGAELSPTGDAASARQQPLYTSIARELENLLNTRAPLPIDVLEARQRSTIDYGIPDLSAFPTGDLDAMRRLAHHIEAAIRVYEPRLEHPRVEVSRMSGQSDTVAVEISHATGLGPDSRRASFRLALTAARSVPDED